MPRIVQRHPSLRWLVPAGVLAIAGLAASGLFSAGGATAQKLPALSADALIQAATSSTVEGYSGTVVSHVSLGLPDVPLLGAADRGASFTSLLTGSHTLQVWYGGPREQRIAVLGATEETDFFRNRRDLWQWDSADRSAVHAVLPRASHRVLHGLHADPSALMTPNALASSVFGNLDSTTAVSVRSGLLVADRSAYELRLVPRAASSKIASVRVDIDGRTKVPLGVQVYAHGATSPSIDVAFTSIDFARPTSSSFRFVPPSGAHVRTLRMPQLHPVAAHTHTGPARGIGKQTASVLDFDLGGGRDLGVAGSGWTTVLGLRLGTSSQLRPRGPLARALVPVSGSWGAGRLFESDLFSVLFLRDGRVYAGAVEPSALYAAAATH